MPSGVDSPKYLAMSGAVESSRLAYHSMIKVGRVLSPLDHVCHCLCILLDGTEEVLDARLGPVRTVMFGDLWLGQYVTKPVVGRRRGARETYLCGLA